MSFEAEVKKYLKNFQEEYKAAQHGDQHTKELSFRTHLDVFFRQLSKELNSSANINIILEPKNQGKVGRPDWRIHDADSLGVYGYVEAKGLTDQPINLKLYQKQIDRYLTLEHKLVITDGIDFVFCFSKTPVSLSLIDKSKLSSKDWSKLPISDKIEVYMKQLFSNPAPQELKEEELIKLVAKRTRILADVICEFSVLPVNEAENESEQQVILLLEGLKDLVYNHNDSRLRTEEVFSDFVAQVIMFCILYAHRVKCSREDSPKVKAEKIRKYAYEDVANFTELMPFHDLMIFLNNNNDSSTFINQWVDECIDFLSFVKLTEEQQKNPDFHKLFESFFNHFDKQARFDYGAYYTPKKLADFIVRLTNKIVDEFFDGATIYDDGNTIIDPCCGTGSFLEQIVLNDKDNGAYNLCGFEILPAPYMLANYRIALDKAQNEQLKFTPHIILANTLSNCLLGEKINGESIEGKELIRANKLSSLPLKLIIGNPPCSDSKRENDDSFDDYSKIKQLTDEFRPPKEKRRSRQNIQKQIYNPFMLFMRWGCEKLFQTKNHSILALVVPLTFLENESYQYARKYLIEHFSKMWAIVIDSDLRRGSSGKNMFKTRQGRAVLILMRKCNDSSPISELSFLDISNNEIKKKESILEQNIDETYRQFETIVISGEKYSFIPVLPYNQELYASFWPVSAKKNKLSVFLNECSGAKMSPTALFTHVKQPMLKRRSREIAKDGIKKATEWISRQDKKVADDKIIAFQDALKQCKNSQELEAILNENIIPCSFRPYVNSYAIIWDKLFEYQKSTDGEGTRGRPELKHIYELPDTIGFSLSSPKEQDIEYTPFASFCWYFPDNDLCKRNNARVYSNQYCNIKKKTAKNKKGKIETNINGILLEKLSSMTSLHPEEIAKKVVFYSYAVFCSQLYLNEFKGALFVVNQSDDRARIPIVNDSEVFNKIAELGGKLAILEKKDVEVENKLNFDYDCLLNQIPSNFHLEHSKSKNKNPYDEINEKILLRDENSETVIEVPCPITLQKFKISGYNVIKDCWLKFHSYRYTHCDFSSADFKELLDLLNKIAKRLQIVAEIDELMHSIIDGTIPLISYNDEN